MSTGQGLVWSGEEYRTRAASFISHTSRTPAPSEAEANQSQMWQQTEKPYLQRNNEPFGGLVMGGELRQRLTNADSKQVLHGQDWRQCSSKAWVKWGL